MDFAEHMVSYYKGEWLEAVLLTMFGFVMAGVAFAMWQNFDNNGLLKGLFYPVAFLAAFTFLAGSYGVYNNRQRLANMPVQLGQNPVEFVHSEQRRFNGPNGVNSWWIPIKLLWAFLLTVGIGMTFFARSDFTHGLAIGLILIGAMGFVIDGFAHHRAKIYSVALSNKI